jgi:hypothetical protein
MIKRSTLSVVALLLVALAQLAWAWFPVSHQYFGCSYTPYGCQSHYVNGNSAPDALKPVSASLHSFDFALTLLRAASASHDARFLNFSLGFGSHLMEDLVGHHANGFIPAATDHYFCLNVDAWLSHKTKFQHFDSEVRSFVAAAAVTFLNNPQVTVETVERAMMKFDLEQDAESIVLDVYPAAKYQGIMISQSVCKATSFTQVQSDFALSEQWIHGAIDVFVQAAKDGHVDPIDAAMNSFVDGLFQQHGGNACA